MFFIQSTCSGEGARAETDADRNRIFAWLGECCIGMDPEDAVELRDALSRAITEAATAAAKAAQAEVSA